ncbi:NAD(P)-binding protein [Leucogyrophana mollusca]|uniref:NAD(P)-binding protein n=1 Tax=Leucogyrophana mollusca TaxID=85980 RepID=A0ACB8BRF2_9AGAM|nr:NAD(P)-binding protein [Leucogyrophana mollusca]
MASPQVWFITGAASGFGRSMTELVLARGDIAVATARRPERLSDLASKYSTDHLLIVDLDVTKQDQIKLAFAQAKTSFGRIDVVYNNAAQSVIGEVECVPDDLARSIFEVNFWAVANISREAVRFFREENPSGLGGTLLQMSSVLGMVGIPCQAHLSACKFAIEGFSECLNAELEPEWNIRVLIIEPGWFRTKIILETPRVPSHPAYQSPSSHAMQTRREIDTVYDSEEIQDVDKASIAIYNFLRSGCAALRLPLGKDSIHETEQKIARLTDTVKDCRKWSEDLAFDKV